MSSTNPCVNFDELADLCLRFRCFQSPSLFHGVLAGQLCGQERLSREHWLLLFAQLLGAEKLEAADEYTALQLFDQTLEELSTNGLNFEPLIPDELYELEERFSALVKWTQGFLKSLTSAQIEERELSTDAKEGLEDLHRLAAIEVDELPADEQNEKDLTSITEFVRMVAMLLYTEIHPGTPQVEKAANPNQPTLH